MRAVIQRVSKGEVRVDGRVTGSIGLGIVLLLGVCETDGERDLDYLLDKSLNLRIFDDADGQMNLSLLDVGGEMLVVSQFTLYGDTRRGRRPSFVDAAKPDKAKGLYDLFVETARKRVANVQTGRFRAVMEVELINDGPVTILIDSEKKF
jgi:D-tyrosyl-tRNA(Tyr) deacylase